MNWFFGVLIREEDGDHVVSVRDLPEVVTSGGSVSEALELAGDAIEAAVSGRIEDEMDLPAPTSIEAGERMIALEPALAAKASVYHLWRKARVTKTELARRLARSETEVRRILDPRHGTKLGQMQAAARALGARLVVGTA